MEINMEFRPCIDIHNGKVKQIVGGSLCDEGDEARENFVAEQDAAYFAKLYRSAGLRGGHVILLNSVDSPYYEATKAQALAALGACPKDLQAGGGIGLDNAQDFLDAGASHVIVTSYVFRDGVIRYDRLSELTERIGREHLVLDLSCKRVEDKYLIVTDRWQKLTREEVTPKLLEKLSGFCDEFLIHAVDVEGKSRGIECEIVKMLGEWQGIPTTYAGGVHSYEDLERIRDLGRGHVNVTIGSSLDLFGGPLNWEKVLKSCSS